MASALPIPPPGTPFYDPKTGEVNEVWRRYLLSLENLAPVIPPIDAQYWVSRADTSLTNERNIGALSTGYVKITTAAGTATPSSVSAIPGTDVTGAAVSTSNDTNVSLTASGTPLTALLRAVTLTLGWIGQLGLSRGGTNADLSATGGTSLVLRQSSAGAAVTVSQLASTDISGIAVGVYTPTLTNVTNLDGSTSFEAQYLQVGTRVVVSGLVQIDPTAAAATELGISLPVASNLATEQQCTGTACARTVQEAGGIFGDTGNDRASLQLIAVSTANHTLAYQFMYQVI